MSRTVPSTFDSVVVRAIDDRLDHIVADQHVSIPWAVESGSRAWGFASPDSDYDCRFVFIRSERAYLTLWPERDVIETPLDAVLDVNGWDLAKFVRLLVKGNAVAIEWLRSPIIYRGHSAFRDQLDAFAVEHVSTALVRNHYFHLGIRQWARHGSGSVASKKLFYALRPAAALRWMRVHDGGLPPMRFSTVIEECEAPATVSAIVADLLAQKALTRELDEAPLPAAIVEFINREYEAARATMSRDGDHAASSQTKRLADRLFLDLLDSYGTHA